MALKGGHISDFGDSLAEAIEQALGDELQAVRGQSLPADGQDDRRLLFVAIGEGVLRYLKAHQNEILKSITLDGGSGPVGSAVTALDLNVAD